jgi:hypothetical protein
MRCHLARLAALLLVVGCTATLAGQPLQAVVAPPPVGLGLDPYYAKYVDAGGIPVIGSSRVPDVALVRARDIMLAMLERRPDLRAELELEGVRVGVMADKEQITDLPEYRHLAKPTRDDPRLTACERGNYALIQATSDRDYWNSRVRGLGGLFTTAGAENLMGLQADRYYGENIFVHEFSHVILGAAETVDPNLYRGVKQAYAKARAKGLWKGDYASVTAEEYWAEGTQYWFDDNKLARLDGDVNVVSHSDLARYDPALYAMLAKVYRSEHRIAADAYYRHPARFNVPVGYKSAEC